MCRSKTHSGQLGLLPWLRRTALRFKASVSGLIALVVCGLYPVIQLPFSAGMLVLHNTDWARGFKPKTIASFDLSKKLQLKAAAPLGEWLFPWKEGCTGLQPEEDRPGLHI